MIETNTSQQKAVEIAVEINAKPIQVEAFVEGDTILPEGGSALAQIPNLTPTHYQDWIQSWITELNPRISPLNAYEVGLRLTNDAEIQQLNTDFRQQNKPTDVLSFAALEATLPGAAAVHREQPVYLGDIIISIETAHRQALQAERTLAHEVAWLTAHGLLHLLGWDHPDDESLTKMLDQQDQLLSLVSVP